MPAPSEPASPFDEDEGRPVLPRPRCQRGVERGGHLARATGVPELERDIPVPPLRLLHDGAIAVLAKGFAARRSRYPRRKMKEGRKRGRRLSYFVDARGGLAD